MRLIPLICKFVEQTGNKGRIPIDKSWTCEHII